MLNPRMRLGGRDTLTAMLRLSWGVGCWLPWALTRPGPFACFCRPRRRFCLCPAPILTGRGSLRWRCRWAGFAAEVFFVAPSPFGNCNV